MQSIVGRYKRPKCLERIVANDRICGEQKADCGEQREVKHGAAVPKSEQFLRLIQTGYNNFMT